MELIKKIKAAEVQAQQIIEQAKTAAAAQAEQGRKNRLQALEQAEQQRKKAIEDAVAAARTQALTEAENLKAQAEKDCRQLHDKANAKINKAAAKVMGYLKG
jgi:vacuolar-type H+-ATPase subunit H